MSSQTQRQPSTRSSKPPPVRHPSTLSKTEQPQQDFLSRSSSQRRDSSRGSVRSVSYAQHPPPQRTPSSTGTSTTAIGRNASASSRSNTNNNNNNNNNHGPPSQQSGGGKGGGPGPVRRPTAGLRRQNTLQTRYMEMLLSLDTIPRLHNILASFFGWLLLAGYVVFPGTFSSLSSSLSDKSTSSSVAEAEASRILNSVQNTPLLIIASVACGLAILGLLWLCFLWRHNYVWLLNRIYLPCATNSLAGLISSLVSVYTQKNGAWSIMAKVTAAVEAGAFVVCGLLFVVNTLMLKRVKRKHGKELTRLEREQQLEDEEAQGGGDLGLLEKAGRKLNQPAVEPQSVI